MPRFFIGGNNISFNSGDCPGTNVDPLLRLALGNYGGSTQTIPLLPGSPALDAYSANCLTATSAALLVRRGQRATLAPTANAGFYFSVCHQPQRQWCRGTAAHHHRSGAVRQHHFIQRQRDNIPSHPAKSAFQRT
ncbi:MAG: choice-of-anchor Q domain-containing protein [Anaerolineae bacterium]